MITGNPDDANLSPVVGPGIVSPVSVNTQVVPSQVISGGVERAFANLKPEEQDAVAHAHGVVSGSGTPAPAMVSSEPRVVGPPVSNAGARMSDGLVNRTGSVIDGTPSVGPPSPGSASVSATPSVSAPSVGPSAFGGLNVSLPPPPIQPTPGETELARLQKNGAGYKAIQNPFLRDVAGVADTVGSIIAPRWAAHVPGSTLNNERLQGNAEKEATEEQGARKSAADVAHTSAETGLANAQAAIQPSEAHKNEAAATESQARADAAKNPPTKQELEGKTIETENGIMQWNPETHAYDKKVGDAPGKFATQHVVSSDGSVIAIKTDPKTGKTTHEIVYHGDPKVESDLADLEINGVPHKVIVNKQTGKTIQDLGPSGIKPPVTNITNQDHQEQMKGKELLDKAEGSYRQAVQGANTLTDFVNSAKAGNKVTAQALPLEGALEITTTAGTKRINRTEVENYAGAGSLWDNIMGKIGKLKAGQPIPEDVQNDSLKLAKILQSNAYSTYKDAHSSAVKRYGLKNEEPLPGPGADGGVDPQVKAYADKYFGGDVSKAQSAIDQQNKK